jgi:hypothetical protein
MPSAEVMALGSPGQKPLYTLGTTPGGWGILRGTGAFFADRVRDWNAGTGDQLIRWLEAHTQPDLQLHPAPVVSRAGRRVGQQDLRADREVPPQRDHHAATEVESAVATALKRLYNAPRYQRARDGLRTKDTVHAPVRVVRVYMAEAAEQVWLNPAATEKVVSDVDRHQACAQVAGHLRAPYAAVVQPGRPDFEPQAV